MSEFQKGMRLSKREVQIMQAIISGMATREIAKQLYISENTVSNHRRNLLKKSGVKNSTIMRKNWKNNKLIFEKNNSQF